MIRVAFCDLSGSLILSDFGVTSSVKHFSKNINWFFDTSLTKQEISQHQLELLNLGPKFVPNNKKPPLMLQNFARLV